MNAINLAIDALKNLRLKINEEEIKEEVSNEEEIDCCCICMDNFTGKNEVILECGHKIHLNCYNELLFTANIHGGPANKCPLCRHKIKLPEKVQQNMRKILTIISQDNQAQDNNIFNFQGFQQDFQNIIINPIDNVMNRVRNNLRSNSTAARIMEAMYENGYNNSYTANNLRVITQTIRNTSQSTYTRNITRLLDEGFLVISRDNTFRINHI